MPVVNACEPSSTHAPISESQYQCSLMHAIQPAIDAANRVSHVIGERPYRVFLVWQKRDRDRGWVEARRKELIPVHLVAMDSVDLSLTQGGLQPEGGITLTEISPIVTNDSELRGHWDGEPWETGDFEFFYEVVMQRWCAGSPETKRKRFTLAAEPHFDGGAGQFRVQLLDQEIARSSNGRDRTIGDQPYTGPRIIP